MPNCFQLFRKGETEPIGLNKLDKELCDHFNEPVSEKYWFRGWYNSIGFSIATGADWGKLRDIYYDNPELLEVIDYLEEHFTYNAWCERQEISRLVKF